MLTKMTQAMKGGMESAAKRAPELFTLVVLVLSFFWFIDRSQRMAAESFRDQADSFRVTIEKLGLRLEANSDALRGVQQVLTIIMHDQAKGPMKN